MMRSYARRRASRSNHRTMWRERDDLKEPSGSNEQKANDTRSGLFPLQMQEELSQQMRRAETCLCRLQREEENKKTRRETDQDRSSENRESDTWNGAGLDTKDKNRRPRCNRTSFNADESTISKIGCNDDIGGCQFLDKPMSKEFSYFEVTIVDYGRRGWIGVGLAHQTYPLNRMPGWDNDSVAYHCDDGKLFHENGKGTKMACPAQEGDVIGCGTRLNSTQEVDLNPIVFFTRNGEEIGSKEIERVPRGGFFPTIGLRSEGEKVEVNLDVEWKPPSNIVVRGLNNTVLTPIDRVKNPRWKRDCIGYNEHNRVVSYICGHHESIDQVGLFQDLSRPMSAESNYFEVKLLCMGRKSAIGIGIANATYPLNTMPGLKNGSAAFHCHSGKVFKGVLKRPSSLSKLLPASRHDVIGCGIEYIAGHSGRVKVFFTRNHDFLIDKFELHIPSGGFYPTIGMMSYGEEVKLNFDTTPPPQTLNVKGCAVKYRSARVYVTEDIVKFTGRPGSVGVYQDVSRPISRQFSRFEVTVKDFGLEGAITIGLATRRHSLNSRPSGANSVALRCDDGHLYKENQRSMECIQVNEQDVIGCGIDFTETQKEYVPSDDSSVKSSNYSKFVVFFTHNGCRLPNKVDIPNPSGGLFPTVSMQSPGEVVQINTLPESSVYDVAAIRSIVHEVDKYERVGITSDRIYYVENMWNDVGGLQLKTNIRDQKYFEVKILNKGQKSTIGIGIAKKGYSLDCQPGWRKDSIAFHCHDGYLYHNGHKKPFFGARNLEKNDVVGCGIDEEMQNADLVSVFFTHNGKAIGSKVQLDCKADVLHPTVCMSSPGEEIKIISTAKRETGNTESNSLFSRSERIEISPIGINGNAVRYRAGDSRPGVIQMKKKITKSTNYFSVAIDNQGDEGSIGIGLASKDYRLDCMPGWLSGSVGYYSKDGCLFEGTGFGRPVYEKCCTKAIIGCGVDYRQSKGNKLLVYFTYNGTRQKSESTLTCPRDGLFPTIGLLGVGDECTVIEYDRSPRKMKCHGGDGQDGPDYQDSHNNAGQDDRTQLWESIV